MSGDRLTGGARHARPALSTLSLGALVLSLLTGCSLGSAEETPSSTAPITASPEDPGPDTGRALLIGNVDGQPVQRGEAEVDLATSSHAGGKVTTTTGPEGERAFSFPEYQEEGPYPRAVLLATNAGNQDQINPGTRDFTWGADFKIATRSWGRDEDNGDNIIQRGLFSEPTLFKAEVDLDRAACVVRGAEGEVTIRSGTAIVPGLWYHIECQREGLQLRVTVWPLSDPNSKSTRIRVGQTGDVTPADPKIPISIGGKVSSDGSIVQSATDQLNGSVADPFLTIGAS